MLERVVMISHCADPNYTAAFRKFIDETLRMPNAVAMPCFGGWSHPDYLVSFIKQVKTAREKLNLTDVFFLGHRSCRWFNWHPPGDGRVDDQIRESLLRGKRVLTEIFHDLKVTPIFVFPVDGSHDFDFEVLG